MEESCVSQAAEEEAPAAKAAEETAANASAEKASAATAAAASKAAKDEADAQALAMEESSVSQASGEEAPAANAAADAASAAVTAVETDHKRETAEAEAEETKRTRGQNGNAHQQTTAAKAAEDAAAKASTEEAAAAIAAEGAAETPTATEDDAEERKDRREKEAMAVQSWAMEEASVTQAEEEIAIANAAASAAARAKEVEDERETAKAAEQQRKGGRKTQHTERIAIVKETEETAAATAASKAQNGAVFIEAAEHAAAAANAGQEAATAKVTSAKAEEEIAASKTVEKAHAARMAKKDTAAVKTAEKDTEVANAEQTTDMAKATKHSGIGAMTEGNALGAKAAEEEAAAARTEEAAATKAEEVAAPPTKPSPRDDAAMAAMGQFFAAATSCREAQATKTSNKQGPDDKFASPSVRELPAKALSSKESLEPSRTELPLSMGLPTVSSSLAEEDDDTWGDWSAADRAALASGEASFSTDSEPVELLAANIAMPGESLKDVQQTANILSDKTISSKSLPGILLTSAEVGKRPASTLDTGEERDSKRQVPSDRGLTSEQNQASAGQGTTISEVLAGSECMRKEKEILTKSAAAAPVASNIAVASVAGNDVVTKGQIKRMKTEAKEVLNRPIVAGFGFKMLEKMGWKEGEGLGKSNKGILEPIWIDPREGKAGLFSAESGEQRPKRSDVDEQERLLPLARNVFVKQGEKRPASAMTPTDRDRMGALPNTVLRPLPSVRSVMPALLCLKDHLQTMPVATSGTGAGSGSSARVLNVSSVLGDVLADVLDGEIGERFLRLLAERLGPQVVPRMAEMRRSCEQGSTSEILALQPLWQLMRHHAPETAEADYDS
eukprot:TRINITY_DN11050_c0_g1_i1.p1 TRINITY_DN11050_c0_g1~~TRINITY_DN11050_c0_g1_i1.p1  ORF type:complete len:846 (-),score=249.42 TRINITY_DN11050_c0_g1_i1:135-2672(-)